MDYVQLTSERINVDTINNMVSHNSCGAVSFFCGTTRDNFDGRKVLSLEYEAYESMALREMKKICRKVRDTWCDVVNIAIYHRVGRVAVNEISVVIAISAPHRRSSLDAVSFAIDELKKSAPIWKKELYDDEGGASWKANKESGKCKRLRRSHFSLCPLLAEELPEQSRSLVQIVADEFELNRRIQCFIDKKREEINLNNIMDYTVVKCLPDFADDNLDGVSTCARTNTAIIKQDNSKCHLKVRRVKNQIGPQIRPDYLRTLDKLMSTKGIDETWKSESKIESAQPYANRLTSGLQQRVTDLEKHLNMAANNRHICTRIKAIEDRLLHLESLSPEYRHFKLDWSPAYSPTSPPVKEAIKKEPNTQPMVYSIDDLDALIDNISESLVNPCVSPTNL